jgi:glutamate-1-semialdehyde 2,1-aminomutase
MNNVDIARSIIESQADEIAGIVIDPIVNKLGFMAASPEFLKMLREVTTAKGILLIYDEVYSLRLGFNGAQGAVGVIPDLTALGKIIGGGLPVGAVGGRADIMTELFDPRHGAPKLGHGGTFNANPMTMAAGAAAMELFDREAFNRLSKLGDRLREGLKEALKLSQLPGVVTGGASLIGLFHTDQPFGNYRDLVSAIGSDRSIGKRSNQFFQYLLNHGVYMAPMGFMVLSTAMDEGDIDYILDTSLKGMQIISEQST